MKLGCVYKERNDIQQALYWFRKSIQQEEILGIHTDFSKYSEYMIEQLS